MQRPVGVARVLVDAGADVNHEDRTEQSAYLISTSEVGDDPRLLDLLLADGADPAIADRDGVTALQHAVDRGFTELIELLAD